MRLSTRFIFLSNELPKLTDSSGALASRFIILHLIQSFWGKEDLELEGKLLQELPGILRQAVAALQDLLKQGHFKQPQSARDAVDMFEGLTSPIGRFVRDYCNISDPAAGLGTPSNILYEAWQKWCTDVEYPGVGSKETFFRNLLAAVPGLKKKRDTGFLRQWGYLGIQLKPLGER